MNGGRGVGGGRVPPREWNGEGGRGRGVPRRDWRTGSRIIVRSTHGEVEAEGVDGVPQVPHGAVAQAPPPLEVDAEERSVESAESRAAKGGGGSRVPSRVWKPGRTWRSKRMSIERRNATSVPRLVMVTPVSVA